MIKINYKHLDYLVKKTVNKVLNEAIDNQSKKEFKIIEYRPSEKGWDYIKENKNLLWNFLDTGYKYANVGSFCGCDSPRSLVRNANLIKIGYCDNAVCVYTGYRGGFKNVGIAATINEEYRQVGKEAVKSIIKTDISNYENYFWTECSGVIEILYSKYHGIKIPNVYASTILNTQVFIDEKDNDGFQYFREIKGTRQKKVIFGFNNEEIFEKVKSEREEYINNSINWIVSHQIDEGKENPSFDKYGVVRTSINVINFFFDYQCENECYEFPQSSLDILNNHVSIIENALQSGKVKQEELYMAKLALENGKEIIDVSAPMKLYKF